MHDQLMARCWATARSTCYLDGRCQNYTFAFWVFFNQFNLLNGSFLKKISTRLVFSLLHSGEALFNDFLHFFFDARKVFVRNLTSFIMSSIVVETIFDSWTNTERWMSGKRRQAACAKQSEPLSDLRGKGHLRDQVSRFRCFHLQW